MRNWDFSQNGHFDSCLAAQLLSSLRNSSALTGTPEEERKTVAVTRTLLLLDFHRERTRRWETLAWPSYLLLWPESIPNSSLLCAESTSEQ